MAESEIVKYLLAELAYLFPILVIHTKSADHVIRTIRVRKIVRSVDARVPEIER